MEPVSALSFCLVEISPFVTLKVNFEFVYLYLRIKSPTAGSCPTTPEIMNLVQVNPVARDKLAQIYDEFQRSWILINHFFHNCTAKRSLTKIPNYSPEPTPAHELMVPTKTPAKTPARTIPSPAKSLATTPIKLLVEM